MVYLETWEEFASKAEELYLAEPERTRYSFKYRHCDGKLELKVTDDRICLKYRTDQLQDVKRMDKLNAVLFRHMLEKPSS